LRQFAAFAPRATTSRGPPASAADPVWMLVTTKRMSRPLVVASIRLADKQGAIEGMKRKAKLTATVRQIRMEGRDSAIKDVGASLGVNRATIWRALWLAAAGA
jgi:hypothetical protein